MRKKQKQAFLFLLSAASVAQLGLAYGAATPEALTKGAWAYEKGAWAFYNENQVPVTGWVHSASGWYYINPADGKLATGWQTIGGIRYYFNTAADGLAGQMRTGWYQAPDGTWFFFNNNKADTSQGSLLTGWQWIDGYCYFFSPEKGADYGKMLSDTTTPDGYLLNADGRWTDADGKPQVRVDLGFRTAKSLPGGTEAVTGNAGTGGSGSSGGGSSSGGSHGGSGSGTDQPSKPEQPEKPDQPGEQTEYRYLLMNIPYEQFYAAELAGNSEAVDAVSSATKNKTRTDTLVGGSYHVAQDGTDIQGVTFPVKVSKDADLSGWKEIGEDASLTITVTNRGQTTEKTYQGREALFEAPSYAYYVLPDGEIPAQYKTLQIGVDGTLQFGAVEAEDKTETAAEGTLSTKSNYGDYELRLEGLPESIQESTVYGVVLHTEEGEDYGLRHLENIWLKTNLAWSAGFVTTAHGNQLSYQHYASMMEKHLNGLTYYTSSGKLEIPLAEPVYVPVKFTAALSFGADGSNAADNTEGKTGLAIAGLEDMPSDFDAVYQVTDAAGQEALGFTAAKDRLTWDGTMPGGSYQLSVTDSAGKYAPVSGSFVLNTAGQAAEAKQTEDGSWTLVKAADTSDQAFAAYLASITAVKVDGIEYRANGRGSVSIINAKTGAVNLDAKANGKPLFETGKTYQLEVIASGYRENLSFAMTVGEQQPSGEEKEAAGQAAVQNYGYEAKVMVRYDSASGKIISVADNGTTATGSESFWENGKNLFDKLSGLTLEQVRALHTEPGGNHADAISGATYSSDAIRRAVISALESTSGKPAAPKVTAKDRRTKLLYAATGPAELEATAEEGAQIVYTLDGSDPTAADNQAVQLAENGVISVEASENADKTVTLKVAAKQGEIYSDVTEAVVEFAGIPGAGSGIKIYEGSASVNTPSATPYEAKLRITTTDGIISKVEDNGTNPLDIRDEAFWEPYLFNPAEEGINERFAGKTLEQLLNAKTVPGDEEAYKTDAITGATVSSDAAKYAAINALRADPVEEIDKSVVAPVVKPGRNYGYVTNTGMSIRLDVDAAAGTTVYYTTDGSVPTIKSQVVQSGYINLNETEPAALLVRFAAFDEKGNSSQIVERYCVFTDGAAVEYETGTYRSEVYGVGVTLTVERNYGATPIATSIQLDAESEERYAAFLPALLAEVYLRQTAEIEPLDGYDAEAQEKVLNAVQKAFDEATALELPEEPDTETAADGTWYGTASIGRNYEQNGPDVIKLVVEDGKIKSVETVLYREDAGYEHGAAGIMELVTGMTPEEVTELNESFETGEGNAPDAVSHATDSAKGHLSAIQNALERAVKYGEDQEEQTLAYMDFVKKPTPQQSGETLNLSDAVLRLHFTDGTSKEVPYDELADYGVVSTPEHGAALPDSEDSFLVQFTEETSLCSVPARVQRQAAKKYAYASYMEVSFEDGTSETLAMDKTRFRYEIVTDKKVAAVTLYDEADEKIADGVYDEEFYDGQWIFSMKQVPVTAGFDKWYYTDYYLEVKPAEDNSPIKSFQLISNQMKMEYEVGEKLDLGGIHVYARTEAGSELDLKSWEACAEAGFTIDPPEAEDYVFEEPGIHTITFALEIGGEKKTAEYWVRVNPEEEQALPASILLYDTESFGTVAEIAVDRSAFMNTKGKLGIRNVKIPASYKGALDRLAADVLDADGAPLAADCEAGRNGAFLRVLLPEYTKFDKENGAYITLSFVYEAEEPLPDTETDTEAAAEAEEEDALETEAGEMQDAETEAEVKAEQDAEAEQNAENEPEAEAGAEGDAALKQETEAKQDAETGEEAKSEEEQNAENASETDAETAQSAEEELEAESEAETKAVQDVES